MYIWEHKNWPHFVWNDSIILQKLSEVRHLQGMIAGKINVLGLNTELKTSLNTMTNDIINSFAIEGVNLDMKAVRSSVAWQLGLEEEGLPPSSHYIEGLVDVMTDAIKNHNKPLTKERLFSWHCALFPNKNERIVVGNWRQGKEDMQIISGRIGKEKVHYIAPPSSLVPKMINELINWANDEQNIDPIIKSAVISLWFVSIHPFGDGNGRISRTLMDMFLTRSDGMVHRFYSMSAAIHKQKNKYYAILEKTQKGDLNITEWIMWFLNCMHDALRDTEKTIEKVLHKSIFWDKYKDEEINERQRKVLNKVLEGFEGKLTTSKWAKIAKCSTDTALRDITNLLGKNILVKFGEGKGTYYEITKFY